MPPWLDSAEEVGAVLVAVLAVLGTVGVAAIGTAAALIAAWRAKVKPMLAQTQQAASHAADQLTPNHGSTVRDSVGRMESTLDRLDRSVSRQLGEVRSDMTRHHEWSERQHAELFRRVRALETPMEDTRP